MTNVAMENGSSVTDMMNECRVAMEIVNKMYDCIEMQEEEIDRIRKENEQLREWMYENCPLNKRMGYAGKENEKCLGFSQSGDEKDDEPCETCKECKLNVFYEEE